MHRAVRFTGTWCTAVAVLATACGRDTRSAAGLDRDANAAPVAAYPATILERPELQQLVDAGLDRRVAPLLEALDDPDPAVRATAAHALASVQDSTARTSLAARLDDGDAAVRRNAAFALGQLGGHADARALIAALRDEPDPTVRIAIFEATGRIGDQSALGQVLDADVRTDRDEPGIALALYHFARRGVIEPRAAQQLLDLLDAADAEARMAAALALAVPRMQQAAGVSREQIRSRLDALPADSREAGPLLRALARYGDAADLAVLRHWLESSPHWTVRAAAAAALGGHAAAPDNTGAATALLRALDDPSVHVATVAAESVVALRGDTDSAPVRDALDPRVLAAWIRTHADRPTVAATLLPGLVDTSEESLVIEWAMADDELSRSRSLAWPALALVESGAADSLLIAGLSANRRDTYVAAAALARRLDAARRTERLRTELFAVLPQRLRAWGPHAPGSDVRGVNRLLHQLSAQPQQSRDLLAAAAAHPHAEIRAAARTASGSSKSESERRAVNWSLLASLGPRPCLEFETARGSFIVELHPEAAPLAVSSLLEWAADGMYDSLTFHRVEPDFILQSGDYDNAGGYGGPESGLRSEFSQLRFVPGTLGIASYGKDTEGSQFFITHNYAPSLDGRYSAAGRVIAGQAVADAIALGDALIAVSLYRSDAHTPDTRSPRCVSQ